MGNKPGSSQRLGRPLSPSLRRASADPTVGTGHGLRASGSKKQSVSVPPTPTGVFVGRDIPSAGPTMVLPPGRDTMSRTVPTGRPLGGSADSLPDLRQKASSSGHGLAGKTEDTILEEKLESLMMETRASSGTSGISSDTGISSATGTSGLGSSLSTVTPSCFRPNTTDHTNDNLLQTDPSDVEDESFYREVKNQKGRVAGGSQPSTPATNRAQVGLRRLSLEPAASRPTSIGSRWSQPSQPAAGSANKWGGSESSVSYPMINRHLLGGRLESAPRSGPEINKTSRGSEDSTNRPDILDGSNKQILGPADIVTTSIYRSQSQPLGNTKVSSSLGWYRPTTGIITTLPPTHKPRPYSEGASQVVEGGGTSGDDRPSSVTATQDIVVSPADQTGTSITATPTSTPSNASVISAPVKTYKPFIFSPPTNLSYPTRSTVATVCRPADLGGVAGASSKLVTTTKQPLSGVATTTTSKPGPGSGLYRPLNSPTGPKPALGISGSTLRINRPNSATSGSSQNLSSGASTPTTPGIGLPAGRGTGSGLPAGRDTPSGPGLTAGRGTEQGLPARKYTEQSLPAGKDTPSGPGVPAARGTVSGLGLPTVRNTKPGLPAGKDTEPGLPAGRSTPSGPGLPAGRDTTSGPGLPTGRGTEQGLPAGKDTPSGPGLPAGRGTASGLDLPTVRNTEPGLPAGRDTEPGLPAGRGTPSGPGLPAGRDTLSGPGLPTGRGTEQGLPAGKDTPSGTGLPTRRDIEPGLPAGRGTEPRLPAGRGTEPGLPAGRGTEPGLPAGRGTEPGLPIGRGTPSGSGLPAGRGTEPSLPAGRGTKPNLPAARGTEPGPPAGRGTPSGPGLPAGRGTEPRLSAEKDTRSVPGLPAGRDTPSGPGLPTGRGTEPRLPAGRGTEPGVPAGRGTEPGVPAGRGTSLTSGVPAGRGTEPGLPSGRGTKPDLPAGRGTEPGLPAGRGTEPGLPTGRDIPLGSGLPAGRGTSSGLVLPAVRSTTSEPDLPAGRGTVIRPGLNSPPAGTGAVAGPSLPIPPAGRSVVTGPIPASHPAGRGNKSAILPIAYKSTTSSKLVGLGSDNTGQYHGGSLTTLPCMTRSTASPNQAATAVSSNSNQTSSSQQGSKTSSITGLDTGIEKVSPEKSDSTTSTSSVQPHAICADRNSRRSDIPTSHISAVYSKPVVPPASSRQQLGQCKVNTHKLISNTMGTLESKPFEDETEDEPITMTAGSVAEDSETGDVGQKSGIIKEGQVITGKSDGGQARSDGRAETDRSQVDSVPTSIQQVTPAKPVLSGASQKSEYDHVGGEVSRSDLDKNRWAVTPSTGTKDLSNEVLAQKDSQKKKINSELDRVISDAMGNYLGANEASKDVNSITQTSQEIYKTGDALEVKDTESQASARTETGSSAHLSDNASRGVSCSSLRLSSSESTNSGSSTEKSLIACDSAGNVVEPLTHDIVDTGIAMGSCHDKQGKPSATYQQPPDGAHGQDTTTAVSIQKSQQDGGLAGKTNDRDVSGMMLQIAGREMKGAEMGLNTLTPSLEADRNNRGLHRLDPDCQDDTPSQAATDTAKKHPKTDSTVAKEQALRTPNWDHFSLKESSSSLPIPPQGGKQSHTSANSIAEQDHITVESATISESQPPSDSDKSCMARQQGGEVTQGIGVLKCGGQVQTTKQDKPVFVVEGSKQDKHSAESGQHHTGGGVKVGITSTPHTASTPNTTDIHVGSLHTTASQPQPPICLQTVTTSKSNLQPLPAGKIATEAGEKVGQVDLLDVSDNKEDFHTSHGPEKLQSGSLSSAANDSKSVTVDKDKENGISDLPLQEVIKKHKSIDSLSVNSVESSYESALDSLPASPSHSTLLLAESSPDPSPILIQQGLIDSQATAQASTTCQLITDEEVTKQKTYICDKAAVNEQNSAAQNKVVSVKVVEETEQKQKLVEKANTAAPASDFTEDTGIETVTTDNRQEIADNKPECTETVSNKQEVDQDVCISDVAKSTESVSLVAKGEDQEENGEAIVNVCEVSSSSDSDEYASDDTDDILAIIENTTDESNLSDLVLENQTDDTDGSVHLETYLSEAKVCAQPKQVNSEHNSGPADESHHLQLVTRATNSQPILTQKDTGIYLPHVIKDNTEETISESDILIHKTEDKLTLPKTTGDTEELLNVPKIPMFNKTDDTVEKIAVSQILVSNSTDDTKEKIIVSKIPVSNNTDDTQLEIPVSENIDDGREAITLSENTGGTSEKIVSTYTQETATDTSELLQLSCQNDVVTATSGTEVTMGQNSSASTQLDKKLETLSDGCADLVKSDDSVTKMVKNDSRSSIGGDSTETMDSDSKQEQKSSTSSDGKEQKGCVSGDAGKPKLLRQGSVGQIVMSMNKTKTDGLPPMKLGRKSSVGSVMNTMKDDGKTGIFETAPALIPAALSLKVDSISKDVAGSHQVARLGQKFNDPTAGKVQVNIDITGRRIVSKNEPPPPKPPPLPPTPPTPPILRPGEGRFMGVKLVPPSPTTTTGPELPPSGVILVPPSIRSNKASGLKLGVPENGEGNSLTAESDLSLEYFPPICSKVYQSPEIVTPSEMAMSSLEVYSPISSKVYDPDLQASGNAADIGDSDVKNGKLEVPEGHAGEQDSGNDSFEEAFMNNKEVIEAEMRAQLVRQMNLDKGENENVEEQERGHSSTGASKEQDTVGNREENEDEETEDSDSDLVDSEDEVNEDDKQKENEVNENEKNEEKKNKVESDEDLKKDIVIDTNIDKKVTDEKMTKKKKVKKRTVGVQARCPLMVDKATQTTCVASTQCPEMMVEKTYVAFNESDSDSNTNLDSESGGDYDADEEEDWSPYDENDYIEVDDDDHPNDDDDLGGGACGGSSPGGATSGATGYSGYYGSSSSYGSYRGTGSRGYSGGSYGYYGNKYAIVPSTCGCTDRQLKSMQFTCDKRVDKVDKQTWTGRMTNNHDYLAKHRNMLRKTSRKYCASHRLKNSSYLGWHGNRKMAHSCDMSSDDESDCDEGSLGPERGNVCVCHMYTRHRKHRKHMSEVRKPHDIRTEGMLGSPPTLHLKRAPKITWQRCVCEGRLSSTDHCSSHIIHTEQSVVCEGLHLYPSTAAHCRCGIHSNQHLNCHFKVGCQEVKMGQDESKPGEHAAKGNIALPQGTHSQYGQQGQTTAAGGGSQGSTGAQATIAKLSAGKGWPATRARSRGIKDETSDGPVRTEKELMTVKDTVPHPAVPLIPETGVNSCRVRAISSAAAGDRKHVDIEVQGRGIRPAAVEVQVAMPASTKPIPAAECTTTQVLESKPSGQTIECKELAGPKSAAIERLMQPSLGQQSVGWGGSVSSLIVVGSGQGVLCTNEEIGLLFSQPCGSPQSASSQQTDILHKAIGHVEDQVPLCDRPIIITPTMKPAKIDNGQDVSTTTHKLSDRCIRPIDGDDEGFKIEKAKQIADVITDSGIDMITSSDAFTSGDESEMDIKSLSPLKQLYAGHMPASQTGAINNDVMVMTATVDMSGKPGVTESNTPPTVVDMVSEHRPTYPHLDQLAEESGSTTDHGLNQQVCETEEKGDEHIEGQLIVKESIEEQQDRVETSGSGVEPITGVTEPNENPPRPLVVSECEECPGGRPREVQSQTLVSSPLTSQGQPIPASEDNTLSKPLDVGCDAQSDAIQTSDRLVKHGDAEKTGERGSLLTSVRPESGSDTEALLTSVTPESGSDTKALLTSVTPEIVSDTEALLTSVRPKSGSLLPVTDTEANIRSVKKSRKMDGSGSDEDFEDAMEDVEEVNNNMASINENTNMDLGQDKLAQPKGIDPPLTHAVPGQTEDISNMNAQAVPSVHTDSHIQHIPPSLNTEGHKTGSVEAQPKTTKIQDLKLESMSKTTESQDINLETTIKATEIQELIPPDGEELSKTIETQDIKEEALSKTTEQAADSTAMPALQTEHRSTVEIKADRIDNKSESQPIPVPVPESHYNLDYLENTEENLTALQSKSKLARTPPKHDPVIPKGSYNLDFLDEMDANFNPFASNTKLGSSPPRARMAQADHAHKSTEKVGVTLMSNKAAKTATQVIDLNNSDDKQTLMDPCMSAATPVTSPVHMLTCDAAQSVLESAHNDTMDTTVPYETPDQSMDNTNSTLHTNIELMPDQNENVHPKVENVPQNVVVDQNVDFTNQNVIKPSGDMEDNSRSMDTIPVLSDMEGAQTVKDTIPVSSDVEGAQTVKDTIPVSSDVEDAQTVKDTIPVSSDIEGAQTLKETIPVSSDVEDAQTVKDTIPVSSDMEDAQTVKDTIPVSSDVEGAQTVKDTIPMSSDMEDAQTVKDTIPVSSDIEDAQTLKDTIPVSSDVDGAQTMKDTIPVSSDVEGAAGMHEAADIEVADGEVRDDDEGCCDTWDASSASAAAA